MKKSAVWKYIAGIAIILCIGIIIGVLIGMSLKDKEFVPAEENGAENVTDVPTKPPTQIPAATSAPTQTPTVSPSPAPTPTATPTPVSAPTQTPTVSPSPASTPTSTPTLTSTPVPTSTPTSTPTPVPTSASTPTPTQMPAATPTPTLKPTSAPTPTARPEQEDEADDYAEKDSNSTEDGYFGRLHVAGTCLADENNNPVQLRGISTHGIGWFPQYVNKEAIHQFNSEWGCNVFRIAMYTAEGAGYCTNGDSKKSELKELVHKGVRAAIAEDMYAIIDWHVLQDQDPNRYKDEAKKFFGEMAEEYGNDPHVIYEICNEPNGGTSWSMIKQYALEVIPVIRKHAPDAVIIVGTPTWSQDVDVAAKDPITEYDNIMYALHFYASTHTDSLRNKCKAAVAAGLPVFVSEYGICEASGNGYINFEQADKWIKLLDSLCISHVAWNLSNKNESSSMIAAGCDKVSRFTEKDLSEGGKWFVRMLGNEVADADDDPLGEAENAVDNAEPSGTEENTEVSADLLGELITAGNDISITVVNSWDTGSSTGVQLSLTVKNTSGQDISDWTRILTVKAGFNAEISQFWNCAAKIEGNIITVTPAEYNKNVEAGKEIGDIGIILNVTEE